ncbi:hypothetical protein C1645_745844 [Glomus cerebriforme]|uniref:Uncharacterized protein n=1 Tax=Glomus cerebriforme TaxID=658196 RepID=A0A397S220_9GLOM|nr:hypothetical protein C1645_745844 [Glomus cerebriforme]
MANDTFMIIMSIETFEEIISSYADSLKNECNLYLISQDIYNEIKKALQGELVQDASFRKWARLHFCLVAVAGVDHIVHVKLNNRTETAKNNINKNIHSLPALFGSDVAGKAIIAKNFLSRLQKKN